MACILHIETATDVCSVALSEDGAVLFTKEDHDGPQHAVTLGVFVDEVLSMADSHAKPIDAVAVSCGPGSYTGLRIGEVCGLTWQDVNLEKAVPHGTPQYALQQRKAQNRDRGYQTQESPHGGLL